MRDFTLHVFKSLCEGLKKQKYEFITFHDYCSNRLPKKSVIMRHDVDRNIKKAIRLAEIENNLDIKASYYFLFYLKK